MRTLTDIRARLRRNARRLDQLERERTRTAERPAWGFGWCRHYLPNYFAADPADFHGPLFDRLGELHARRDTKAAVIAPREGAKSTITTLAYVLHVALEGLEKYVLLLSDSGAQAVEKLADVRRELEGNARLAADYPDACGIGPQWRTDRIELRNGVVIQATGRKGRVRGRRNREARPSLVIFDDVESNAAITSPTERATTWRWATREVIPAGSAGTNYLSVGSALHRECAAVRLGQLAGWEGRTYRAVHRWPDRMDLWEEWERLATNLADPDRAATAAAFFEANQAEMERGAETYWPKRWTLHDLMKRRAEIGAAAFDTEYQGVPSAEGLTEWPAEFFDRAGLWFDDWPTDLYLRVQSLDPSKGADAESGDYQAHTLVGLGRDGTLYVEAQLAREVIPLMIDRALNFAARSGFGQLDSLAVEDNDVLGMLVDEFTRQTRERGRVVPVEGVRNTQNKLVRIRRLGVYFARNRVRFRNTAGTRMLVDQLRDFPGSTYDDGADALELAVRRLEIMTNPR